MRVQLENNYIKASVDTAGAQLASLIMKEDKTEYIWQADPDIWKGSAPILFPIIGGLKDDTCIIDGAAYSMPGHGIVRKREWALAESAGDTATFEIASDAETRDASTVEGYRQ